MYSIEGFFHCALTLLHALFLALLCSPNDTLQFGKRETTQIQSRVFIHRASTLPNVAHFVIGHLLKALALSLAEGLAFWRQDRAGWVSLPFPRN